MNILLEHGITSFGELVWGEGGEHFERKKEF
jgi:hypothetical protein